MEKVGRVHGSVVVSFVGGADDAAWEPLRLRQNIDMVISTVCMYIITYIHSYIHAMYVHTY